MKKSLKVDVPLDEESRCCGSLLILKTSAKQPIDGWVAYEDDIAVCDECGQIHYLHHDGEGNDGWFDID